MKKRYNYFDDENIEKPVRKKAEHNHSHSKNNHSGTVHEAEEKLSRDIKKFAGKTKRVAVAIAKQSEEKFEEERKFEPKKLALQMCLFVADGYHKTDNCHKNNDNGNEQTHLQC